MTRAMRDRLAAAAGFDRALVLWRCETVSATLRFLDALRAELPFGGYKQSGWGSEMGHVALNNYTEVKAVTTQP